MTHLRSFGALCALVLVSTAVAGDAAAQSILASRGLGYPLEPVDARGRALGGVAVGFGEPRLSLVNPASVAGLPAAAFGFTYQGDSFSPGAPGAASGSTARFPAIQVAVPLVRRLVVSAGYASVLDQNWQVEHRDSLLIADERREVVDRFASRGGPARLRLGAAYQFGRRVGAGVGLDVYSGAATDSVSRSISGLFTSLESNEYRYESVGASAGVRWTPGDALAVAASVTGGGSLRVIPRDEDAAEARYGLPLRADVGATARVAQATSVVLAGRWAGWSSVDEGLTRASARDVTGASAGMEYEGFTVAGRTVPLRVGARMDQLPFSWQARAADAEFSSERALSAGLGLRMAGVAAQIDLAGERGWRTGGGLDEPFWRLAVSVAVLGR